MLIISNNLNNIINYKLIILFIDYLLTNNSNEIKS